MRLLYFIFIMAELSNLDIGLEFIMIVVGNCFRKYNKPMTMINIVCMIDI